MKISVITVNFNSKDYLEKMLSSFEKQILSSPKNKHSFEFIVVNNEPTTLKMIVFGKINPRIIQAQENIGFGAANNLAAKQSSGDFLFFLNPDTRFVDASVLEMFAHISNSENIGAIGPKLLLAKENRPQPWTCGKKTGLLEIFFRNTINKPWNKYKPTGVDWLSGTALLVKKEAFEKTGGFDENYFMYFEDQDLCLRLKSLGKEIIFYPMAQIMHFDGKSWDQKKAQKTHYYQSQDYFFQKHHGAIKSALLKILRSIFK